MVSNKGKELEECATVRGELKKGLEILSTELTRNTRGCVFSVSETPKKPYEGKEQPWDFKVTMCGGSYVLISLVNVDVAPEMKLVGTLHPQEKGSKYKQRMKAIHEISNYLHAFAHGYNLKIDYQLLQPM